jgi:hypothetical protein
MLSVYRMRSSIPFLVAAATLSVPSVSSAGPLDDVRSEVHSSDSSSSDDSSDSDSGGFVWDDDDDGCLSCTGTTELTTSAQPGYLPYPYADGLDGYVRWEEGLNRYDGFAFRASTESAYQYQGLWRVGVSGRATVHFLEMESTWSYYRDTRAQDSLWIGDANLGFTALRLPRVLWHVSGGGRFLVDTKPAIEGQSGNAAGWNASTGIDVFPFDPVVLTTQADFGQLGAAWFWQVRGSIGIQITRAEFFAGYEHLQIGNAPLGGPMIGLRIWL